MLFEITSMKNLVIIRRLSSKQISEKLILTKKNTNYNMSINALTVRPQRMNLIF